MLTDINFNIGVSQSRPMALPNCICNGSKFNSWQRGVYFDLESCPLANGFIYDSACCSAIEISKLLVILKHPIINDQRHEMFSKTIFLSTPAIVYSIDGIFPWACSVDIVIKYAFNWVLMLRRMLKETLEKALITENVFMLNSNVTHKTYQTRLLIGWQHSRQSIRNMLEHLIK